MNCDKCNLDKQCLIPRIPGRGNLEDPYLIMIGEAPGRKEDQEGQVFVGRAGDKLSSIVGNKISCVYITNINKCCPYKTPLNKEAGIRTPTDFEIECCRPFLLKELKIFDPNRTILMPMGGSAYHGLFGYPPKGGLGSNVGRTQEVELEGRKFTVIPNFHPAYLLEGRHPEMEPKFVGVLEHAFEIVKNKREGKVIKESSEWEILTPQRAIQEFKRILELKDTLKYIYIDLETPSFEIEEKESNSEIIMINFAHSLDYQGYSVPLKVTNQVHHLGYPYDVPIIEWNISPEEVEQIRELFSQIVQMIPLIAHVLKFDLKCLLLQKWIPDLSRVRIFDDTSLLTHLVYNQRLGNLKLKDVCRKLFNVEDDWEKKVKEYIDRFRLKADKTFDKIPTGIFGEYGALDAFYNKKLHIHLLEKMPEKLKHLRDVMNYLVIVYTEAELAGFPIDQSILDFLSSSYGKMLEGMVEKALTFDEVKSFIRDKTEELKVKYVKKRSQPTQEMLEEESFGMTKLKPLASVIYGKKYFGMPVFKQTKGGKDGDKKSPSTDQEAVDLLLRNASLKENQKKFIENLADFRTISKLKSTYVDNICGGLKDDIYHYDFILPGTVTGRLGSAFHVLPHSSDIKNMYTSRWKNEGGLITSADFCLALGTRVLTADLKWEKIETLEIGDDLIGFDEQIGRNSKKNCFRRSLVERKSFLRLPCYRITTTKGSIISSEDHLWVTRRKEKNPFRQWIKTKDLSVGDSIGYVCDPWEDDDSFEAGYLRGFFDGEGFFRERKFNSGGNGIVVTQKEGEVIDYVCNLLNKKKFTFTIQKSEKGIIHARLNGGKVVWRFLGSIRPFRLLKKFIDFKDFEGERTWGGGGSDTPRVEILSIEYIGEQEVVGLKTSTNTFIAEGMMSHNSQLELRILSALSQEYKMIDAFIAGIDIHAKTASEIYHVPIDQVTEDQRQVGKVTNFSIIYGKTAETLKDDLHCTKERAQEVIDNLLVGYDKVSDWIMARYREVSANASVVTAFGREIPIPEWTYNSRSAHLEALRMSQNYPIQSAASDLVKSSISRFHKKIKKMGMKTIFMGDTHDAIHNDLYPRELFDIVYLMKLTCENESMELYKDWLICPIRIDVSLGVSIGNEIEFEIKELEDDRILLEGEGTRRDFNLLMSVGSEAYQMNLSVEKETPIKPEKYSLDRVIRDKVNWSGILEIKRK